MLMMRIIPNGHHDQCKQEHKNGNPVNAMHQFKIYVAFGSFISMEYIDILQELLKYHINRRYTLQFNTKAAYLVAF